MKNKISIIIVSALLLGMSMSSCREKEIIADDIVIPGLGGHQIPENEKTELDHWLTDTFTDTYNIEVIYRWDASTMYSRFDRKIVPVDVAKVQPSMSAVAKVWFGPYEQIKGKQFLLDFAPKTIVLVGSAEWDQNGRTLGQAEGGNKITLLAINESDPTKAADIKELMHVIEHEFAHILHQTKPYPTSYAALTPEYYDASGWYNNDDDEAYELGFISPYAMSGEAEDFVEMISLIMVNGRAWFENTVMAGAAAAEDPVAATMAVSALRKKLDIVENYLWDSWEIRFFDKNNDKGIVTLVQEAIAEVTK